MVASTFASLQSSSSSCVSRSPLLPALLSPTEVDVLPPLCRSQAHLAHSFRYGLTCLLQWEEKAKLTRFFSLQIMMRRSTRINCPEVVYATLKSFGSGIIIATAFIHVRYHPPLFSLPLMADLPSPLHLYQLLAPAFESLGSECLTGTWGDYSWAPAIAMSSLFAIFLVELVATRTGTKYLRKRGLKAHDPHHSKKNERGHTQHGVHIPQTRPSSPTEAPLVVVAASSDAGSVGTEDTAVEVLQIEAPNGGLLASDGKIVDLEEAAVPATGTAQHGHGHSHGHGHADDAMSESALAQILGVAILEFGVLFHVGFCPSLSLFASKADLSSPPAVLRHRPHPRRHVQLPTPLCRPHGSPNLRRTRTRNTIVGHAFAEEVPLWCVFFSDHSVGTAGLTYSHP